MRKFSTTPAASIPRSRGGFQAELQGAAALGARPPGSAGRSQEGGRPAGQAGASRASGSRSLLPLPAHRHHPGTGEPEAAAPLVALPAPSRGPRAHTAGGALSRGRTYTTAGGASGERSADCGSEGDRPLGAQLRSLGSARHALAGLSNGRARRPRPLPEPRARAGRASPLSRAPPASLTPGRPPSSFPQPPSRLVWPFSWLW